jgi:hypothetical protein
MLGEEWLAASQKTAIDVARMTMAALAPKRNYPHLNFNKKAILTYST